MPGSFAVNMLIIGSLARETIINSQDQAFIDFPGGDILYAAYGAKVGGTPIGLITKISENYPQEWIQHLGNNGFNTEGIIRLPDDIDHRRFFRIFKDGQYSSKNPHVHFLEIDQPFPKTLLGYSSSNNQLPLNKKINHTSILPSDIPSNLFDANNIYLSNCDLATLSILPAYWRTIVNPNIFVKLNQGLFKPARLNEISSLINSSKILFTSEEDLKNLILKKEKNVWEAAKIISNFDVEMIIFISNINQINIYVSHNDRKISIPVFFNDCLDTVGCYDTFIGGFLGKYTRCFDPISSAAFGSVVMGIKIQGSKPEFILDSMPELIQAKFEKVRAQIFSIR